MSLAYGFDHCADDIARYAAYPEFSVKIRGKGKGAAQFWTCDLTEGYIRINASYRT